MDREGLLVGLGVLGMLLCLILLILTLNLGFKPDIIIGGLWETSVEGERAVTLIWYQDKKESQMRFRSVEQARWFVEEHLSKVGKIDYSESKFF